MVDVFHIDIFHMVTHMVTMADIFTCVQELEREVRQALAAASVGDPTPIRGRPGALLDPLAAASLETSPLTFASSQFSPSAWPALVNPLNCTVTPFNPVPNLACLRLCPLSDHLYKSFSSHRKSSLLR